MAGYRYKVLQLLETPGRSPLIPSVLPSVYFRAGHPKHPSNKGHGIEELDAHAERMERISC